MRWTYYIEGTQVFPLNTRSLRFKEALETGFIYAYRKTLDGNITLTDRQEITDYSLIKNLESTQRYDKFNFKVYDNGVEYFNGEFIIEDCSFDDYKRSCTIKITPRDIYTEIQEAEDVEVNIIQSPISDYLELYIRRPSYYVFTAGYYSPSVYWSLCYDGALTTCKLWVTERLQLSIDDTAPEGWHILYTGEDYVIYERQPDPAFTLTYTFSLDLTNDYSDFYWGAIYPFTGPVHKENYNYYKIGYSGTGGFIVGPNPQDLWIKKSIYDGKSGYVSENDYRGISLQGALNYILDTVCPNFSGQVKSSFLFIDDDPETGKTIPDYYNTLWVISEDPYQILRYNKYLIEMSNFRRPSASEAATIEYTTLKSILDFICTKHHLLWCIDTDGNLRIEHFCYFTPWEVSIDLSEDENITTNYEFLRNTKPNRETLTETLGWGSDFGEIEVLYGSVPALNGTKENKISKTISNFYTDVDGLNTHLDELGDEGFVYVDVDLSSTMVDPGLPRFGYFVCQSTGFKSGEPDLQNVTLSNANCLNLYYRHNAYQPEFSIGGIDVEAITLQKLKTQEINFLSDSIPDCKKNIITRIGIGQIKELSFAPVEEYNFKAVILYE